MSALRDFVAGPWRAVLVLGVTQILAWGAIFYPPVLTVPLIAASRGWSITFAMAGFSLALLTAGLVSPRAGALIDRFGGHRVMPVGSLLGALGLVGLAYADHPATYLAVWMLLGVAISASLYDPAFATLGRIFGAAARQPITALTLAGGFASTVSWPVTHLLIQTSGWRGTYLVYAGLLALVAAPLHAFVLPRTRADLGARPGGGKQVASVVLPPTGLAVRAGRGGVCHLCVRAVGLVRAPPGDLPALRHRCRDRGGDRRAVRPGAGRRRGSASSRSRAASIRSTWRGSPSRLLLLAFLLLMLLGISVAAAAAFAVLFGMCNGLITIARGAVPLALFGAAGYGHLMGRIALPFLVMQAIAPLVLAFVAERTSDPAVLAVVAAFALLAFAGLAAIRRPGA